MPKYNDSLVPYGVFNALPPVTNAPEGWTLRKVRMRSNELVRAYYTKGKSTACWFLSYSEDKKSMRPGFLEAANIRE